MRKSINKTTVIIVLAVFLTLSVGYALFSDTITIEGTATAQGNFNIEPTCYVEIPDNIKAGIHQDWVENGSSNASCSVNDDEISYSVGLDYPTANKYFVFQFKNTGTIAAALPISYIFEAFKNSVNIYDLETDELIETLELTEDDSDYFFLEWLDVALGDTDGTIYDDNTDEIEQMYDFDNGLVILQPNQSMYFELDVRWPDKEEYTQDGVYYGVSQTLTFPWQQHTN